MHPNPGHQPEETIGRRVKVKLRNGTFPLESWAADGRNGCNWTLSNWPFDIIEWELAG